MLRSIGITARLVAGFSPGEFNPFTGLYVVHNTDAYAMTEVYFPKYGWVAFIDSWSSTNSTPRYRGFPRHWRFKTILSGLLVVANSLSRVSTIYLVQYSASGQKRPRCFWLYFLKAGSVY